MTKKLFVDSIDFRKPENLELFHDFINISVGEIDNNRISLFKLNIISVQCLEKLKTYEQDEGIYLKNYLILKHYNEDIITEHVNNLIEKCNKQRKQPFLHLMHYLEYEDEEEEY